MNQLQPLNYKHPNQQAFLIDSREYHSRKYVLISYDTIVYEVIFNDNNDYMITIDGTSKYSRTTSKHITQFKEYLRTIESEFNH